MHNYKKDNKIQVSMFASGDGFSEGDGLVVWHHLIGRRENVFDAGGRFYFLGIGSGEYALASGETLEVSYSDNPRGAVEVKPRHVLEALGAGEFASRIVSGTPWHNEIRRRQCAWRRMFCALESERAVEMAVVDTRLVRHLSAEAAALFADAHRMLAEAGGLL